MRNVLFIVIIFLSILYLNGCNLRKSNDENTTSISIENNMDVNKNIKDEVKSINFADIKSSFRNKKEEVINRFGRECTVKDLNEQLISIEYDGLSFLLDKINKQGVFSVTVTKPIYIDNKVISTGITEGELKKLLSEMNMVLLETNGQNTEPWILIDGLEISFIFQLDENLKILKQFNIDLGK